VKEKNRDESGARAERRVWRFLLLGLCFCYLYFFDMGANWNSSTRLALVHAIVDEGRLAIDTWQKRTQDKAFYGSHFFCDKAVGASFLAVPLYAAIRLPLRAALERYAVKNLTDRPLASRLVTARRVHWYVSNYLINVWAGVVPSLLLALLFFRLLGHFSEDLGHRFWLTLALGLGTVAFPFTTIFFGHQTASAFLFGSFYLLFTRKGEHRSRWRLAAAGLLAGYATITDFLLLPISLLVFGYAAWTGLRSGERLLGRWALPLALARAWPFLAALAALLPLQLWYNWACFGRPLAHGYQYEVLREFREGMSQGVMGITYPKPVALFQLTFGPKRGLFYQSPFLLFGAAGIFLLWRRLRHRQEAAVCTAVAGGLVLLNSSYYLWSGGTVSGPRFLIPALPFLAFPAILALPRAPRAFKLLAVVSIGFTWIVTTVTPLIPEASPNPVYDSAARFARAVYDPEKKLWLNEDPNFNFNLGKMAPQAVASLLRLFPPLRARVMGEEVDDVRTSLPPLAVLALVGLGVHRTLRRREKPGRESAGA
jgi:hypothetical protein